MQEVLVNRLGGLSLPRKSVVRLHVTDRPDMTLDVKQQYNNNNNPRDETFMTSFLFNWKTNARFHVSVITQIKNAVVYFIVRRNVKFGCSEC